jgi:hypothetical protein
VLVDLLDDYDDPSPQVTVDRLMVAIDVLEREHGTEVADRFERHLIVFIKKNRELPDAVDVFLALVATLGTFPAAHAFKTMFPERASQIDQIEQVVSSKPWSASDDWWFDRMIRSMTQPLACRPTARPRATPRRRRFHHAPAAGRAPPDDEPADLARTARGGVA